MTELAGVSLMRGELALEAYRLLEYDEQLDLFACQAPLWHIVSRQLSLVDPVDTTLCGSLLPALPRWQPLDREHLQDHKMCCECKKRIKK